ncbi:MAG: condensation domain-containing protein [Pseudomonadota bacterium]
MSVLELFEEFRKNDLQLGVVGENLQILDLKGNLNDSLREKIKLHKQEIIKVLSKNYDIDCSDYPYSRLNEKSLNLLFEKYSSIQTIFPASSLQQGMFFQEAIAVGSCSYSRQLYFNLGKNADLKKYFSAWQKVADANEMLKACFTGFDTNEIHLVVPNSVTLPVEILDYSGSTEALAESAFLDAIHQEKIKPFDYTCAPLMRLIAMKMPGGVHKIIWTYHHSILDGWSLPVVVDAVEKIYQGDSDQVDSISYMEYVKWLSTRDEQEAESYWRECFYDYQYQSLKLGGDKPQGKGSSVECPILFDELTNKKILAWSAKHRTTINSLLHTAWSLVLKRYFNCPETVVGAVVSVRPPSINNVDKIPGLMINTIPVRLRYDIGDTLDSLLGQANYQNIAAMDYGNYPLEKIKKISGCNTQQELFDSLIVFYNYPDGSASLSNTSKSLESEIQASGFSDESNFPVTLLGTRNGDSLALSIKYNNTQVPPHLIDGLANALSNVLRQIVTLELSEKLINIALIESEYLKPIPKISAADGISFPIRSGLKGLLQYVANQNSKKIAIEYEDENYSYSELDKKTNKLARFIKSQLPCDKARVAVLLDKSIILVEVILACVKASIPVLLIDPKEPVSRISKKIQVANIDLLISHSDFSEDFCNQEYRLIDVDDASTQKSINKENSKTIPSDPAAEINDVVFLSVDANWNAEFVCKEISAAEVFDKLCNYNKAFVSKGNVVRACSSAIQSDWFGFGVLSSACNADHLVLVNEATDLITNNLLEVAVLQVTAEDITGLLNRKYAFEGVQRIDIYGGKLVDEDVKKLQKYIDINSVMSFSTSEQGYLFELCHQVWPSTGDAYKGWLAAPGENEIYVLDDGLNVLPTGAIGWLCHKSVHGETRSSIEMVKQFADGSVEFIDANYQYYYNDGRKIYFSEVEQVLKTVSGVIDAITMVRTDAEYEKGVRLVAYLVMKDNFIESLNGYTDNEEYYDEVFRIKRALSPLVLKSMIPDTFVFMESLPQHKHPILIRKNLRSPDKINKERRHHEEPTDDIERKILAFWEGGLLLNGLSVTDDYFDLGGSSLLQIKLLSLINKEFLVKLTWEDLFNKKATVRSQASRIKQELVLG